MSNPHDNVDAGEIAKFSQIADKWWDKNGEFKPLHDINPLRLDYIDGYAGLAGKRVLDVGCGGGILSESMAKRGAEHVTGIDMAEKSLQTAAAHAAAQHVANIYYRCIRVEDLAAEQPHSFDVVTCMEMMEHVPRSGRHRSSLCETGQTRRHGVFLHHQPQSQILSASDCRRRISVEIRPQRHARLEKIHHAGRTRSHVPPSRIGYRRQQGHDLQFVERPLFLVRLDRG